MLCVKQTTLKPQLVSLLSDEQTKIITLHGFFVRHWRQVRGLISIQYTRGSATALA